MPSFRVPNVLYFDAVEPAFPYVCYAKCLTPPPAARGVRERWLVRVKEQRSA